MQLTCPCCYARFPVEAALNDVHTRAAITTALSMPSPLGGLILQYLGLFRPPKRALDYKRINRLLNDLLEPIQKGQVQRHGRAWAAPRTLWKDALETVLAQRDTLRLPLKDHSYLMQIIVNTTDQAEAKTEQATENRRRQHPVVESDDQTASSQAKPVGAYMDNLRNAVKGHTDAG